MQLSAFQPSRLAQLPTPLDPAPRLQSHLGGPRLFIKRDDLTGLGLGGNKARKLEFLLGEALAQGADTILTVGALQSNHARQTAAACAKLGLKCELILRRSHHASESYLANGNVLLDRLFGARLTIIESGANREEAMEQRACELRAAGARPYLIAVGGSCITGNLGYVACAEEMLRQAGEAGITLDAVVLATGSGGTHAGLVAGFLALRAATRVIGIAVEGTRADQESAVYDLAADTALHLGITRPLPRDAVTVLDEFVGQGYARPTMAMRAALGISARLEGIVLDPVYTGKAMSGLIGLVQRRYFRPDENVVFLHTGGVPGLFAYPETVATI